jgi:Family of unknown function (DUF6515)
MNVSTPRGVWVLCLAAAFAAAAAYGQSPEHPQGQVHPPAPVHAQPVPHYSQPTIRLNHSHYYPPHGTAVSAPPPAPVIVNHPSGRYYYSGGVWYAPRGPAFVVVPAPVGVFVPVLPAYYTTLWVGGAPYYYANDTYYNWNPAQNSYEVVSPPSGDAPPPDDAQEAPPPATPNDDLFVYPQRDQTDQQQATDRYECHKWAGLQSGFDPTQAGGAASPDQPGGLDDYQRAMKACLEGRGYSVR